MVKSIIYPDIIYKEDVLIDDEDIGYDTTMYDYSIYGISIIIVLGKAKYTYANNSKYPKYNIVYFPIYLVINSEPCAKIGIFEVESHQVINIMDDDGDMDLNKGNVIIYASDDYLRFIIKEADKRVEKKEEDNTEIEDIMNQKLKGEEKSESISEGTDKETAIDLTIENDVLRMPPPNEKTSVSVQAANTILQDGIFIHNQTVVPPPPIKEETEEESTKIKLEYKESHKNNWMQKFTKNMQYGIIDNEGAGDCFFAVIRDAFHQIGKDTSVEIMRALLAKEATEDLFNNMKALYVNFLAEYQEREKEMKAMKTTNDVLKKRINKIDDKEVRTKIIEEAKRVIDGFTKIRREKEYAKELLDEYIYMKDINNVTELKTFIMTRNYWADTWAISTLERLLNIKIIILSEEAYASGDVDSVLTCGQLNDEILENNGTFTPDYYILTCYTGRHYKLITYKCSTADSVATSVDYIKYIFKFHEIPYDIKAMVINKCVEKNAGPYYIIKDFRDFKNKLGYESNDAEDEQDDEYLNKDLYDNNIVFMFHANSNSKPKAGMGSGEKIPNENKLDFMYLNKIVDWRKMLDDSWAAPFTVDSRRWNTVEHYYLGSQFKKGFPDFYHQFALDSGSDISKDLELARAAGSKSGKLNDRILREPKIKIDPDFYEIGVNPRSKVERKTALTAKFVEKNVREVLLQTKQAKLLHFIRKHEPEIDELLMQVRKEIHKLII